MNRDAYPFPLIDPIPSACDRAGEVYPFDPLAASDFTTVQSTLHRLQQEIADEAARSDVECIAADARRYFNLMPCYRLDALNPDLPTDDDVQESYRRALDKAARYCELRGLLVRPDGAAPEFVCFRRQA